MTPNPRTSANYARFGPPVRKKTQEQPVSHCALAWISREGHTCYCSKSYHIMELQKPCTYVLTIKNAQADQSLARSGPFAQEHERPSKGSCKYNCGHRFDLERSASVVRSGCSRSGPATTCAKLRTRGLSFNRPTLKIYKH